MAPAARARGAASAVALFALAAAALLRPSSALCLDPTGLLCLDWAVAGSGSAAVLTFNATCTPPRGQARVWWCGFGVSNTTTSSMFPADALVLQLSPNASAPLAGWAEDRNSAVGFQAPPCYATQGVSTLLALASDAETGALRATWTRPATLPAPLLAMGYQNIPLTGTTTVIAASASDVGPASAPCAPSMWPHSMIQPGVAVAFGGPG
jgi:hypothetical protein